MSRLEKAIALVGGLLGGLVAFAVGVPTAVLVERWWQRRTRTRAVARDVRHLNGARP